MHSYICAYAQKLVRKPTHQLLIVLTFEEQNQENQKTGAAAGRTAFVLENAEEYEIPPEADRFYFFNPFSVTILRRVIGRVVESYYAEPREMLLFFYYPSDEYISYLMTIEEMMFADEIDCRDLFVGENERERIMVFQIG